MCNTNFEVAVQRIVQMWKESGREVTRESFQALYECQDSKCHFLEKTEKTFVAKATDKFFKGPSEGQYKLRVNLGGRIVCASCAFDDFVERANNVKESIDPNLSTEEAWEQAKKEVGVVSVPLLVAMKAYQQETDKLEKELHRKLQEVVHAVDGTPDGVGSTAAPYLRPESLGCQADQG